MALKPFVPLTEFSIAEPVKNHSYRTYKYIPPSFGVYDLMVSNGLITEVIIYDLQVSDAEAESDLAPLISLSTSSLVFGEVEVDMTSDIMNITVTNVGTAPLEIAEINLTGGIFTWVDAPSLPITLSIGSTLELGIEAEPAVEGLTTGSMVFITNAASSPNTVALSVTGVVTPPVLLHRLHTDENQIVTEEGTPIRLKAVNWFGGEGTNYTPHGTWARSYKSILDQIKGMGFNCVRLPFSGDTFTTGRMPVSINYEENPDLVGMNTWEVYTSILNYCADIGLYVFLDHHRRVAGAGADGSPVGPGYDVDAWHNTWELVATEWQNHPAVIGADLHNEPHDLTWSEWVGYVNGVVPVIQAIASDWLMFVEGVGSYESETYWWGGQLAGVLDLQPDMLTPNTLVYSPHEYGQSVASGQAWLAYEGGGTPVGWPNNLYDKWAGVWGFIYYMKLAPVLVGEFGGHLGYNGSGTDFSSSHRTQERAWLSTLCGYLNGDMDGDLDSDIGYTDGKGMSFAFWSLNPNSADTGGLLQDDWVTPQSGKLALIESILED